MTKVVVVDAEKCYACLGCTVECAYHHAGADPDVSALSGVLASAACYVVAVGTEPAPLVCSHCEDAPCLQVCPTRAISRSAPEAPVLLEEALCIGCRACTMACPFGVMQMRPEGKTAMKCDLCRDRTERGEPPRCVAACPTGALELKELDDVLAAARRRAAELVRAKG